MVTLHVNSFFFLRDNRIDKIEREGLLRPIWLIRRTLRYFRNFFHHGDACTEQLVETVPRHFFSVFSVTSWLIWL